MSETKHTPGPWEQSHRRIQNGMYATQVYPSSDYQNTIATLDWHTVETSEGWTTDREANAQLIAAAPDLLAACKAAKAMIDEALPQFNWGASGLNAKAIRLLNETPVIINEAIAKAEGGADGLQQS